MTTLASLLGEIDRELLHHYTAPQLDVPSATIATSATSINLTSVNSISPGAIIEVGTELMYVTSWVEGTRTATVIRALYGTTATNYVTTDLVKINPRVSTVSMLDSMRDELRSWDERVFDTEAATVSFGANDHGISIAPTKSPYRVLWARPRPSAASSPYKLMDLQLRRNDAAALFPRTYSLHLPPGMVFGFATSIDVLFAVPFTLTTLAMTTDLQSTVGLEDTMLEILKWGVLYRVVAGKQEARLSPFGTIRADIEQSVPALTPLQASAQYRQMRDMAYDQEYRRLLNLYPLTAMSA